MRKHVIDNGRTRRHMYRNAPEALFYEYTVNRDDLLDIEGLDPEAWVKNEMEIMLERKVRELKHRLTVRMQAKYHRSEPVTIPVDVLISQDYDIDYNRLRFFTEVRYRPDKEN